MGQIGPYYTLRFNNSMTTRLKRIFGVSVLAASVLSLGLILPVFAQTTTSATGTVTGTVGTSTTVGTTTTSTSTTSGGTNTGNSVVIGTVSAVNGSTITIQTQQFGPITINISNASVSKNGQVSGAASVAVGDVIRVQGTVNGSNVSATIVTDQGSGATVRHFSVNLQGNGQPIVGGTVSAVNGSTVTVVTTTGITYTVDSSNATIIKGTSSSSLSNIVIGDHVLIQGAVNGTSVTASTIVDSGSLNNVHARNHQVFFGQFGSIFNRLLTLFGF